MRKFANKTFIITAIVACALAALAKLFGLLPPEADWWWMVLLILSPAISVLFLVIGFIACAIATVLLTLLALALLFITTVFAFVAGYIFGVDVEDVMKEHQ